MSKSKRFTKSYDELISLGIAPRLALLYGKLEWHAGADGKCYPSHQTLARELGLKSARQVRNLLHQLHTLQLARWMRTGGANHYEVCPPDRKWISYLIGNGFPASDRKRTSDKKKNSSSREVLKDAPPPTLGGHPKPANERQLKTGQ